MVKLMDEAGIEKSVMFIRTGSPEKFSTLSKVFSKYPDRFDLWCGFDLSGCDRPGFGPNAAKHWRSVIVWAPWGLGKSATKAPASGAPPKARTAPDDPRLDSLMTNARAWECPSTCTSQIPSGPMSPWIIPMTVS